MGFYIRKSISVGPFRFNLSKSGVGVSAGIKGLRVGAGPRGNYVHMGRGGLYYRKTLPPIGIENQKPVIDNLAENTNYEHSNSTHAPLEKIESGTIFAMTDSNSAELLEELDSKRKKWIIWPVVFASGIIVAVLASLPIWWGIFTSIILSVPAYYYDQLRKTVVLFYELDDDIGRLYEDLHHSIHEMGTSKKCWHIEAQGNVSDRKYHAGADKLVERKPTFIGKKQPPFLKTNIEVPAIGVGKQVLFFFPDRLLVFENNAVGAVSYNDMKLNIYTNNFIEDDPVPADAKIIGRTWKYVNKNGGPDKRFSNNREIPIAEYGYVDLRSTTGLNERICLSRTDKASYFEKALVVLAKQSSLSKAPKAKT